VEHDLASDSKQPTTPWRTVLAKIGAVTDLFAYPLRTSHYVELVNPLWTTHTLQARVEKVWDETRDTRTLTLRPGLNWRGCRAGQHVRVGVPIGGMHHTRTYTISSPPERDDGCITITVKAIPGGRMSHHLVRNSRAWRLSATRPAAGRFLLARRPAGEAVVHHCG
jgi:ferredoxin-NADP reductase